MKTRIFQPTATNIRRLAASLAKGGLVGVPAETVYGLAANATDAVACESIFKAKGRPAFDPLIVHVSSLTQAKKLAQWNPVSEALAKQFWPGPLTLVLPKRDAIPDIVTSGLPTVALRMPSHPLFRKLIREAGVPLAAPSANPFGYISPTSAQHVRESLEGRIPAILDGGECPVGVESTIVETRPGGSVAVLRPGAVSRREITDALGVGLAKVKIIKSLTSATPAAPGLLSRHYSPIKPTKLWDRFPEIRSEAEAWVHFRTPRSLSSIQTPHFCLTPDGDGEAAARRLYRLLRELDEGSFSGINLEKAPSRNPWAEVLNDRMKRAAAS